MLARKYYLIIILFIFTAPAFAQSGGLNFTLAFPDGEFKDQLKRTGLGLSIEGLVLGPNEYSPFGIGANFSFLNYGSESRRAPWSNTIPDVTVDVDRSYNIMQLHVLFRIAPPMNIVRPYLDLLFGGSYLFTETKVVSTNRGEEVTSSTNFDDWAWSYGFGGGIMFKVYENPNENLGKVYVDLKVRMLKGSTAEYLKEGSVVVNPANGSVSYYTSRSKTDLITANIGVVAYFSSFGNF
jgi:hypothetical protein